jgi:hypothetical protein
VGSVPNNFSPVLQHNRRSFWYHAVFDSVNFFKSIYCLVSVDYGYAQNQVLPLKVVWKHENCKLCIA